MSRENLQAMRKTFDEKLAALSLDSLSLPQVVEEALELETFFAKYYDCPREQQTELVS